MSTLSQCFSLNGQNSGGAAPNGFPISLLAFTISDSQINISWVNGTSNEDGIAIERSVDNVNFNEIYRTIPGATSYSNTGLNSNTTYYYRVRAFKGSKFSSYSNTNSIITNSKPTDVAGLSLYYNSENVSLVNSKVDQLLDLSGNNRHMVAMAATDARRPTVSANKQNGLPSVYFDGIGNRMKYIATSFSSPFTLYFIFFPGTGNANLGYMGKITSGPILWGGPTIWGSGYNLTYTGPGISPCILIYKQNGTSSEFYCNGKLLSGTGGTAAWNGMILGAYTDSDAAAAHFDFLGMSLYDGVHDAVSREKVTRFYEDKYNILSHYEYDGVFQNSATILNHPSSTDILDYTIRSPFSAYKFQYSGTTLRIHAESLVGSFQSDAGLVYVFVDGVLNQKVYFNSNSIHNVTITLPAGNKNIELLEGPAKMTGVDWSSLAGTYIKHILGNRPFTKIATPNVSEKIIFIGDSIANGFSATDFFLEGFVGRFRFENNKEIGLLGGGSARLFQMAETTTKVNQTVGFITQLFANVTTTKKLVITIGTNDFGIDTRDATTFSTWYGNLLDAIHAADATIQIYCLSPIYRSGETALLESYRTNISALCAARSSYTTYINGAPVVPAGELPDGLHPNSAGHKRIKDTLYSVMYP